MVGRVVVALVLVSCGGADRPGPKGATVAPPAVEPTMGICGDGGKGGLAAAQDALDRGCPREAMADLVAAGEVRGHALFLALQATLDGQTSAIVGAGQPWITSPSRPDESWLRTVDMHKLDAVIKQIDAALQDGSIPDSAIDRGQLMQIIVRTGAEVPCLPTRDAGDRAELKKRLFDKMTATLQYYPGFRRTDGDAYRFAVGKAFVGAWLCFQEDAAEVYEKAAEKAKTPVAAAEARLSAWETRHIPGGRAGSLGMSMAAPPEALRDHARASEAASQGSGPLHEGGTRALAALDKLVAANRLDAAGEARVAWLRSVVALRMLDRPADAQRHATTAQQLAIKAKRADLLDGARLVAAIAAVSLGQRPEAERLFIDLYASTRRRGAIGARNFLVARIRDLAGELAERGRFDDALALAFAARTGGTNLGFQETFQLHGTPAILMERFGRLESAVEERALLIRTLVEHPERDGEGDKLIAEIREHAKTLELSLGRDIGTVLPGTADPDDPNSELAPTLTAFNNGDAEPLRRYLRTNTNPADLAGVLHLACAAHTREIERGARLLKTAFAAQSDSAEMRSLIPAYANALMECGANVRDRGVYQVGREVLSVAGDAGGGHEDALGAEASGDHAKAIALWTRMARETIAAMDAAASIEVARRAGWMLERAAMLHLAARPPKVEEALALLSESRARDLNRARATRAAGQRDPALAKLDEVDRKIGVAASRLRALTKLAGGSRDMDAGLARSRAALEKDLAALGEERARVTRTFAASDPGSYRAAALAPPLSLRDIQSRLAADEVLVLYVTRELAAFAIVVDKTRAEVRELPALDGDRVPMLLAQLTGFRRAPRNTDDNRGLVRVKSAPAVTSRLPRLRADLYDRMVAPLEALIPAGKRVVIVPDELSADIPFAELGPAARPWIERNSIRMLPGTYLLDDRAPAAGKQALLVGDPAFGGPSRVYPPGFQDLVVTPLPNTRVEVAQIAKGLGASPLLGADAVEEEVKKRLPGAALIHLATHGLADPLRPASSVIMLAAPRKGGDDGMLFAHEIEPMRLKARLVVLSACETGIGQPRGTEGTLALDRAFLLAGASTVVSSLWLVDDAATAALMTAFYKELAAVPADVALARAMRAVRSDSRWGDPKYWAAFRVVGSGR